ncbi:MAG TPA: AgmX/PglI C-terminal domain-containing protein [Chitinispirillaceae bacterium]|nr:AgmX/PglI C-terminal domain-containing protein [Chitinispirillaceae bacterium]
MMKKQYILAVNILISFVCLCTKKNSDLPEYYIFGNDTLTSTQFHKLDPVFETDSLKFKYIVIRKALASEDTETVNETLLTNLSGQLSLQSEVEWSIDASLLLLKSTQVIIRKLDSGIKPTGIIGYADSVIIEKYGSKLTERLDLVLDTNNIMPEQTMELIRKLLGVSDYIAQTLYYFVSEQEDPELDKEKVNEMVKGLLSVKETEPKDKQIIKSKDEMIPEKKDKSLLALQYRNHKSIQDSISRHIPDLKLMYKQFLKKDAAMMGMVMVTFCVNVEGKVIDAHVSRTDIKSSEFLDMLISHTKAIRFSSIPEKIGNMIFEFPFEFNTEM